jgi:murein L,D-transpeptidase YafK
LNRRIVIGSAAGALALTGAGLAYQRLRGYRVGQSGGEQINGPRYDRTILAGDLARSGFALGREAHVRIYKQEHQLELWMRDAEGRFALFRTYEICKYSGTLGPKLAEGDRQAPEGFCRVARAQLNPNSRHHLAFNLGYPNAFDTAHGRTGSFLMVHGGCSSTGCYAMTDSQIDEIYAVVEAALDAGQRAVDVSIFPFHMTETALQCVSGSEWLPFWTNLRQGHALFEERGEPPAVAVLDGRYVFAGEAAHPASQPVEGWV